MGVRLKTSIIATPIALIAAGLLLASCSTYELGVADSSLVKLMEDHKACREAVRKGQQPKDPEEDGLLCDTRADALSHLGDEYAGRAHETGVSAANAVFYFRRASTAKWQSFRKDAMREAIFLADEGLKLCGDGIQPGDCAVLGLRAGQVGNDMAVIDLDGLKRLIAQVAKKDRATYLGGEQDGAEPKVKAISSALYGKAFRSMEKGWPSACKKAVDESVRMLIKGNESDIVDNLKEAYDLLNGEMPVASGYKDGDYDAACAATASETGWLPPSEISIKDVDGKMSAEHKTNRAAWCYWQTARRYVEKRPDPCLKPES